VLPVASQESVEGVPRQGEGLTPLRGTIVKQERTTYAAHTWEDLGECYRYAVSRL
jgi:hypothetical protein